MEIEQEETGGTCVILTADDDLNAVPESHQKLLTAEIRAWWPDPVRALHTIADHAQSHTMSQWFRTLAVNGEWSLQLHIQSYTNATQAGFYFAGREDVRGAEIVPPRNGLVLDNLPPALALHNRLVRLVDWMGFGCPGQLIGNSKYKPLSADLQRVYPDIDSDHAFAFAIGPSGDVLVFTDDDRAGWVALGESKTKMLGTVADAIDWVYAKLLAGQCPDM